MMNHFVISNWHNEEESHTIENRSINTGVKILKYYWCRVDRSGHVER